MSDAHYTELLAYQPSFNHDGSWATSYTRPLSAFGILPPIKTYKKVLFFYLSNLKIHSNVSGEWSQQPCQEE